MKFKTNNLTAFVVGAGIIILAAGALLLINNLKKSPDSKSQTPSSMSSDQKFPKRETTITFTKDSVKPDKVEIKKGENVVWLNNSGKDIDIASGDHPTHLKYPLLNFGEIKNGGAAIHKFEKEGTYSFHNHLKPEQKGVVIVK